MFRNIVLTTLSAILMLFPFAHVSLGADLPGFGLETRLMGPSSVVHITLTQTDAQADSGDATLSLLGFCKNISIDSGPLGFSGIGDISSFTADDLQGTYSDISLVAADLEDCYGSGSGDIFVVSVRNFTNVDDAGTQTINADVIMLLAVTRGSPN